MEVEKLAIRDFLANCIPLKNLEASKLDELAMALEIQYFRRDSQVLTIGEKNDEVMLIRSGAIEATDADGKLYGRYEEGEWVGYRSVLRNGDISLDVKTLEDTLFYCLPGSVFTELLKSDERINSFFSERKPERLRSAMQEIKGDDYSLLTIRLRDLVRPALEIPRDTSIRNAAVKMAEAGSGMALVTEDGNLCGIVSDQDFTRKVLAAQMDASGAIDQIMTSDPFTLPGRSPASEAILLMARRNFRHMPIVSLSGEIRGIVSTTDLLRSQSHHAVYLVRDIYCARDVETLTRLSKHLPKALVSMVRSNLPAYDIAHAISSLGQAITRRLIKLAEDQFGQPPVPYCFIVAGSMARREQTAHSDQDNGMILSDDYVPELHEAYFINIANFVCDGLDACGYIYCPGNIMATNPKWRQPVSVWRSYFMEWIERPEPKALLYSSIFFDLRSLYGDKNLLGDLRAEILEKTQKGSLFQAFMAANALSYHPPLGIFKGFVLEKTGDNVKALDMKKRGVVPVIDLARVYSLAQGLPALNTCERLDAIAAASGGISDERIADLKDAFEFISTTRLAHQAIQIEAGKSPDNYVPPEQLSTLERRHLKDAFEVVSDIQSTMSHNYQTDRFR
uniref:Predicted signal-transduction protein containing cAMP-binding and CBS domains n=1 Tax=uncultured Thiotrichaceae bacterium TaxID=298394 RepID=A0A6S6SZ98_9GAMM|nr:MAG: Predicted signal-transduction protein containing cAMP-binding and CBS domains [uncultured Thiotrichaceae bacterium]